MSLPLYELCYDVAVLALNCYQSFFLPKLKILKMKTIKKNGTDHMLKQSCERAHEILMLIQGLHRLENYLNIQDCLEKSLKIKFALKSTGKTLKGLEKSLNFTIYSRIYTYPWRFKSV